ncbi:PREDICTED: 39S ribosomal protein L22, mitochondrial-like [Rhagoletis zephyria]|uniref:39S ribosomal protein L22, mitochondrial-like n=1 Tax=Rhagoletis zephyria TaxID=28612 RepID=UPI000811500A|nr:PREDICTED: 39S ribosomal protein L22, mitochondrial-like [Rhagoletis zephyria]
MHDDKLENDNIFPKPRRWPLYNDVVHKPEDGPVERYYCHYRDNIKYSPKKMYYVASFIRGMSIDEAIKQLTYINMKGASVVKEVLKEAQEIAVAEHNFEYKSKMWIAESFCSKGLILKGYRKHARMRFGIVHYYHTHYMVKLVEGEPPVGYGPAQGPVVENMTAEDRLSQHIEKLRKRRIDFAL